MNEIHRAHRFQPLATFAQLAVVLAIGLSPYHVHAAEGFVDWSQIDPAFKVEFRSGATPSDRWGIPHDRIVGYLLKPDGAGPFPAVVLLHGWMGAHDFNIRWTERLKEWGYVGLLVNSRRADGSVKMAMTVLVHDAFGAQAYLRRQPFVASDRIALAGWGNGGMAALMALRADPKRPGAPQSEYAADSNMRFSAGIAFYPRCPLGWNPPMYAPLLILLGGSGRSLDTLKGCSNLETIGHRSRAPVRVKIYPQATPGFDVGQDYESWEYDRAVYDPDAERDAIEEVRQLLSSTLQ